jgi:geranylgeranyl diphosphate synthase, type II
VTVDTSRMKDVPQDAGVRSGIREQAVRVAAVLGRERPLGRAELETLGRELLVRLNLSLDFLGFAMVAVSNEFWRTQFASIPYGRRVLLLPHCMRNEPQCQGRYDALGLQCALCGACLLSGLKREAETLGYKVLIAEGTPTVVSEVLGGDRDAVLGVACLDSLEKAFDGIQRMGIPNAAVPLLANGCKNTSVELDVVNDWLHRNSAQSPPHTQCYLPLLRAAQRLFDDRVLRDLAILPDQGASQTDAIALDWLRLGGKRLRPFITLAGYVAQRDGHNAFFGQQDVMVTLGPGVRRVAVAIEALHKASLVHDDIEDGDAYRYGQETLHRRYGLAAAINVGDYLIGLGYRLICLGASELGPQAVADILTHLSEAHVLLARGQGDELLLTGRVPSESLPVDIQRIYALKTSPAFEAAMFAGLRAGGAQRDVLKVIRPFCRHLGVAFQVLNDLKDWTPDAGNKRLAGQDLLSQRPTMLRALAWEAGTGSKSDELMTLDASDLPPAEKLQRLRALYESRGVFEKARRLVEKYRARALQEADRATPQSLSEFMRFLVGIVL